MWGELEGMPDPGRCSTTWASSSPSGRWSRSAGRGSLPIGVGKVEYSGPPPAPGEPVPTDVRITDMDEDFVVAEAVLCRPDGTTWCHIEGRRMHIFHRDERMHPVSVRIEKSLVANPEDGGLVLQYERWPGTPTRDLWSHQALRRAERAGYESMTPADRRTWLLEVTAVKEASPPLATPAPRAAGLPRGGRHPPGRRRAGGSAPRSWRPAPSRGSPWPATATWWRRCRRRRGGEPAGRGAAPCARGPDGADPRPGWRPGRRATRRRGPAQRVPAGEHHGRERVGDRAPSPGSPPPAQRRGAT